MAKAKPIRKIDLSAPLPVTAARMIGVRLDEMLAWEGSLADCERVYELHQMRIAAKRLRYTLEIFLEVYKRYPEVARTYDRVIDEIRTLQDHLGEIHDADVLTPGLIEQLAQLLGTGVDAETKHESVIGGHRVDFDACSGLVALCRETRTIRDLRYSQLLAQWSRLRAEHLFDQLRAMLDAASASATEAITTLPSNVKSSDSPPEIPSQDIVHEEESQTRAAPRTRTTRRAQRSERGARTRNGARHSGPGPDSGEGAPEGGTE